MLVRFTAVQNEWRLLGEISAGQARGNQYLFMGFTLFNVHQHKFSGLPNHPTQQFFCFKYFKIFFFS